ncbi:Outer membrane lipoprotein-sorting protein [Segatella bryantii]|uniref:LolA-like putative outer membrane lipoprotein chaperone n=1 Tax=Segatella bryantii TaxID=77095 RepID=UPI0008991767|nr:LolA-like putative outer membrane lipoprotein chaperone [Segatella bryantii]SDZ79195.1 Outer membrane lipoprotein-sorting protein [Segatella bryantii]
MKKIFLIIVTALLPLGCNAQNAALAKKVIEKTSQVIGRPGGAKANFTVFSKKIGTISGTIAIKGTKFNAKTNKAIVWYNGKTQWSYLKSTNEVNVTTPTQAQRMSMNPYTFINIWKSGFKLGVTTKGQNYILHLISNTSKNSISEMYITVNKSSYSPSAIKMRQNKDWTTISIANFQPKNQPDQIFSFNSKDFPSAEVIDLR